MPDTSFIYMVGDSVQINPEAFTYDGSAIDPKLKGNNFNWYITETDPTKSLLVLGAYSAFGLRFTWSPAIRVHENDVKVVGMVCRHSETLVDERIEPTCTEYGKTEGKHCLQCGHIIVPQQFIDPLKHEYTYDVNTGIKTCKRCKRQEITRKRSIDLTGTDVRSMIKIIEGILEYSLSSTVPPVITPGPEQVQPDPVDPIFSDDITFESEWCEDSFMPYLAYTPSSATTDGTTPLIFWLHGYGESEDSESDFRAAGLPQVLEYYWEKHNLKRFNAYIVCPRKPSYEVWWKFENDVYALLDYVIKKYKVDTRKIILMGHSQGASGVEYFAYQKPEYFSCQIIMSPYGAGINRDAMKDFPTKIYVESADYNNDSVLRSAYKSLKSIHGSDNCVEFNCDHGYVPLCALREQLPDSEGVSALLYWALSQINPHVGSSNNSQPSYSLPATVTVTEEVVHLRSGATASEYKVREKEMAYLGHQLKIVEIVENENYTWGKLDPDIWKSSYTGNDNKVSKIDRWIPLESTDFFSTTKYKHDGWVKPMTYTWISSDYGMRTHPITGEYKGHPGIDLPADWGTPIYAARAGTVALDKTDNEGNCVVLYHDDFKEGFETHYYHLEESLVKSNEQVEAGQLIGRCGSTGNSTGPHLHFQIKDPDYTENKGWISPHTYIKFK